MSTLYLLHSLPRPPLPVHLVTRRNSWHLSLQPCLLTVGQHLAVHTAACDCCQAWGRTLGAPGGKKQLPFFDHKEEEESKQDDSGSAMRHRVPATSRLSSFLCLACHPFLLPRTRGWCVSRMRLGTLWASLWRREVGRHTGRLAVLVCSGMATRLLLWFLLRSMPKSCKSVSRGKKEI